jgi:isopentenyl-diphosphate delta-isomerase
MPEKYQIRSRKEDHIRINLEENVNSGLTTGLEYYRFIHRALPEINLDDIDQSQEIFKRRLASPILISSMTGGTSEASRINQILAEAAQETHIALGLGSQRAALEQPKLIPTFQVRQYAPDILLLANLGAIQLNLGYGVEQCLRVIEMIEADALILHLNALQEAFQPEGDTVFSGLISKIESICRQIPIPIVVKEVGWGISIIDAKRLVNAGVSAIDVAGAGGTSWSQVEMYRARSESQKRLAAAFINWGIPTAEAILNVRQADPNIIIFASGGLRTGIDISKCIALGATLGGMAGPFLKAAMNSLSETVLSIQEIQKEIKVCMFASGTSKLKELNQDKLTHISQ